MDTPSPSFAALMGQFRNRFASEVQAARALVIGPTTLSDYCNARSVPTAFGILRLAPSLGMQPEELAALVEAQRAAMRRGEIVPTAPVMLRRPARLGLRLRLPL